MNIFKIDVKLTAATIKPKIAIIICLKVFPILEREREMLIKNTPVIIKLVKKLTPRMTQNFLIIKLREKKPNPYKDKETRNPNPTILT